MVVLEDGFVLTQPDGASRFDLVDPRAYSRIDVFRGPQSALFGNYATGGALAFRTRTGREIDGYEVGTDAGSDGYLSNYFTVGGVSGPVEISLFASDVRANGFQDHSSYDTQTVNLLASYTPTPDNRFTLKVINNDLHADLAARASLNQYRINPYQRGCAAAAAAAPGCTTFALFANGAFGATVPVTATEGAFGRTDRRTIVAGRWEHDIDANTTWRAQVGFDERNFNQPFYTTSSRGSYPSYNLLTDLTRRGELFGLPSVGYVALGFNTIDNHITTFNRAPYGGPRLGALIGDQSAVQSNLGGRARIEVALSEQWTGVLGISAENTWISGRNLAYAYSAAGIVPTVADADRSFLNVAPELALVYRPDAAWALRGRVATGYTTPAASNLFVTPAGLPGNNTGLQTQENLGFDLGVDWSPVDTLRLSLTGFYEFFRNELVAQSPGAGLLSYSFNAPASEHRGIELGAEWAFRPGWRATLAYTFDDQIYTRYVEQLSAGARTARFDRAATASRRAREPAPRPDRLRADHRAPRGPRGVRRDGGAGRCLPRQRQPDQGAGLRPAQRQPALRRRPRRRLRQADQPLPGSPQRPRHPVRRLGPEPRQLDQRLTGLQNGAAVLAGTTGSVFAGAPRTVIGGMRLSF